MILGFNVLSRVYLVLDELLPCIRTDHVQPPEGQALFERIETLKRLETQLNKCLEPEPYRLRKRDQAAAPSMDTSGWLSGPEQQSLPDFSTLLADLLASEPPTLVADAHTQRKHALAITQANVSVTYLNVLLELTKHKQWLFERFNPSIPRPTEVFTGIANALLDALLR